MKILIAGDFCPQGRVDEIIEMGNYEKVLSEIKKVTAGADYSIVNFECPIVSGTAKPIDKVGPALRCSEHGVEAIQNAGFNCTTLANNHFRDFGNQGVMDSLQTLDKYTIDHVGGGVNFSEASQTLYKEICGQTLAVINCCEHEFSIATTNRAGSNPLNPIQQWYAIQEARKHAEKVLVIVHGGHEHFQLPSPRMVETYRFFIDAGADSVVNHHQHCFSGYEIYHGKPIFYGLGNFCFDGNRSKTEMWYEGYMVKIELSETKPSFEIYPYRQCAEEPRVILQPLNAFDERLIELNNIIADADALQNAINEYYSQSESTYSNVFEPIQNRYYLGAIRRGWLPSFISKKRKLQAFNYINCEAHRDKMLFWLKKGI